MAKDEDSSKKITELQKTSESQANTIARLENEIKKLGDVNSSPRIIQKGKQKHPKYQRNKKTIAATLPKEEPEKNPKKE
jgi:hypothetical protein